MERRTSLYKRHRFPPQIIQHAVWLYHRFNLSHRDIEDLLARRGIVVTHESSRLWCNKFGPQYAHRLRRGHCGYGDTFFLDEVVDQRAILTINPCPIVTTYTPPNKLIQFVFSLK